MAGPITAKYRLIAKTFGAYHTEIIRLLKRQKNEAKNSDDADIIGIYDWTGLLKPARDDLAAHIARKDDPHKETMASLGSYDAKSINAWLSAKIPNNVVPISSYGIVDELTDAQVDAAWSASGFNLIVGRIMQVTLSGTVYRMPAQQLNLNSADPLPANKTFNVYVRTQFGYITYQARTDSPPESASVMFIGTCTTGPSGIISKKFASVTRIDTFRISTAPVGSAIPVTTGGYDHVGKLSAAWRP